MTSNFLNMNHIFHFRRFSMPLNLKYALESCHWSVIVLIYELDYLHQIFGTTLIMVIIIIISVKILLVSEYFYFFLFFSSICFVFVCFLVFAILTVCGETTISNSKSVVYYYFLRIDESREQIESQFSVTNFTSYMCEFLSPKIVIADSFYMQHMEM
uniref:Uncharacterized protein n=1 Tax=Heterorhabditis bacteriophora TaxID=37862 RepID=A0A1I7XC74_HETBA